MRKLTKVLVLVAAFTALFALTALAKTGWNSDENGWYYLDADGYKVTDVRKNSNGKFYYLGEDGYMVKDKAVEIGDDLFYYGADGAQVADQWILLPEEEGVSSGEDSRWYRFGSNGKALKATTDPVLVKKVGDEYYGFDAAGKMLFGFVDEQGNLINDNEDPILGCTYWFGDNSTGAMKTGWQEYTDGFTTIDKESAWFYFKPKKGYKYTDAEGTPLIDKKYYTFDNKGIMQTGWAQAASGTVFATDSELYWADNGTIVKSGWVYAAPSSAGGDKAWFRLKNGQKDVTVKDSVQVIKKKYYVFDNDAAMVSGLVVLNTTDLRNAPVENVAVTEAADKWSEVKKGSEQLFYFDKADNAAGGANGWALNGSVEVDFADETVTLVFNKHTFMANHGLIDNYVYDHGQVQKSDVKYSVVNVVTGENKKSFFVDANGKNITKAGRYATSDGDYYVVKADSEGVVRPLCKVLDGEYRYEDAAGKTKYATAATVAKMLSEGTWKETFDCRGIKEVEWH